MTTLRLTKSIGRLPSRLALLLIAFVLACLALSPRAQALLPLPAPDGGYPGGNTAEGVNALHDVNTAVGINNTAVGANALTHDTTGNYNVAVGSGALESNTTGNFNMAIGTEALRDNNANFNLAIGFRVLFMNTTGNHLTGVGAAALRNNTTASFNTAIGADALRENTTGEYNTATGSEALFSNTSGSANTANGRLALHNNTTSNANTATGHGALFGNTTGSGNTANGAHALGNNTTGGHNTALGGYAGYNITGSYNTALGNDAGYFISGGSYNTALGVEAGRHINGGSYNTAVGFAAGSAVETANNVIAIGTNVSGENVSDTCYIGNIFGATSVLGTTVYVNSRGKLGTIHSSRRFKDEIKPMEKASEAIHALKPVTFHYKSDKTGTPQFGLIAEEVAEINPDLVVRDENGEIYSVRYEAVNAMLLNEFLKAHRKNEEQEATITRMQEQIEALTAGLEKVSAHLAAASPSRGGLEESKFATGRIRGGGPAPQMVVNPVKALD